MIEDQQSYINGIALFACHDVSKMESKQFNVNWYKNGVLVEEEDRIDILDDLLLIRNVSTSDVASYHCELSRPGFHMVRKSNSRYLKIEKGMFYYS